MRERVDDVAAWVAGMAFGGMLVSATHAFDAGTMVCAVVLALALGVLVSGRPE